MSGEGWRGGLIFYWISWRFTQIWVASKKKFCKNFLSPQDFIYRRTLLDVFLSDFMAMVNQRPQSYSRKKAWPISVIFRWPSTTLLKSFKNDLLSKLQMKTETSKQSYELHFVIDQKTPIGKVFVSYYRYFHYYVYYFHLSEEVYAKRTMAISLRNRYFF